MCSARRTCLWRRCRPARVGGCYGVARLSSNSRMGEKGRVSMDKKYAVKISAIANQNRPLWTSRRAGSGSVPDVRGEAAVETNGLAKAYGDVKALCGVDLRAEHGSVFGLLGPNGAGKTTAVRILTTLILPDSGTARVAGFDVLDQPGEVRKSIGLAGQYAAVDENLNGFENLELVGRLYHMGRHASRRAGARAAGRLRARGRRASASCARTRAGCDAASTSPPRSSPGRRSSSSTSRPPASTCRAASRSGKRSKLSSTRAPRCS